MDTALSAGSTLLDLFTLLRSSCVTCFSQIYSSLFLLAKIAGCDGRTNMSFVHVGRRGFCGCVPLQQADVKASSWVFVIAIG